MTSKPICLFDSGIGGLTVLKKLLNKFPNEKYIYLADLERVPYGDKTTKDINNFVKDIIEWMLKFEPKLIIMACNTSSALVFEEYKKSLPIPIFGMIESCSKSIAETKTHSKVTIWATKLVAESNAYKKSITKTNPKIAVEEIACPKLVPMIEDLNFTINDRNKIINEYLAKTSKDSQALILGCTHYPLLTEDIKNLTNLNIIDPTDSLLKELEKIVPSNNGNLPSQNISLYATAQTEKLERFSKLYLCGDYKANSISLNKIST